MPLWHIRLTIAFDTFVVKTQNPRAWKSLNKRTRRADATEHFRTEMADRKTKIVRKQKNKRDGNPANSMLASKRTWN